jgi:hypothetical protein
MDIGLKTGQLLDPISQSTSDGLRLAAPCWRLIPAESLSKPAGQMSGTSLHFSVTLL